MDKTLIGLLFILAGICYGSLAIDTVYEYTLGLLIKYNWVEEPKPTKEKVSLQPIIGRKPTILVFSLGLIIIGLFILWNRNS